MSRKENITLHLRCMARNRRILWHLAGIVRALNPRYSA